MKQIIHVILSGGLLICSATYAMKRTREESDEQSSKKTKITPTQICVKEKQNIDLAWADAKEGDYIRIPFIWTEPSVTIQNLCADLGENFNGVIPLHTISSDTLSHVINSLKFIYTHRSIESSDNLIITALKNYFQDEKLTLEQEHALFLAADFLDIKDLFQACLINWAHHVYGPECAVIVREPKYLFPNDIDERIKIASGLYKSQEKMLQSNLFMATLQEKYKEFRQIYFSPNSYFFVSSDEINKAGNVQIWHNSHYGYRYAKKLTGFIIFPGCISTNGNSIVMLDQNFNINIFNFEGNLILKFNENKYKKVQFSPLGDILAEPFGLASDWQKGKFIDFRFKFVPIFDFPNYSMNNNILSPDGTKLLQVFYQTGELKLSYFKDDFTDEIMSTPQAIQETIAMACFSSDSSIIICSTQQNIHLWDTQIPPNYVGKLDNPDDIQNMPHRVCCSADRKTLALVNKGFICFWHFEDNKWKDTNSHLYDIDNATSVYFSPDGKMLIATLSNNTIKIWDSIVAKKMSLNLRQSMLLNLMFKSSDKDAPLNFIRTRDLEAFSIFLSLPAAFRQLLARKQLCYSDLMLEKIFHHMKL
jgi:WD40 repeat protein